MVVNSIDFWIFFLIVFIAYYMLFRKSARWQNITLLVASYVFYGMVDWKMCLLLLGATVVFYGIGVFIAKNNENNAKKASLFTTLGVVLGVGLLFYFKELNFFVGQFSELLKSLGLHSNINTFNIIMPLGISFFTFKLIGYVIEVHRENMQPCKDPIAFGTFIAYFPAIMSGPIDNPTKFIPQLEQVRAINYSALIEGFKRILWGMFLKMCIADQLSGYTSAVLGNYEYHNATSLLLATIFYAFQLYADFAGYSDMAIGVSNIMGIKISENFNNPYFAQNIAEFWRRWHISLTTWITQYVFMPLNIAFRDCGKVGIYAATILNTVIIGAWHGANWTFLLFGLYHGLIIAFITYTDKGRKKIEKKHNLKNNLLWRYSRIVLTFCLWSFSLLMFQANSIRDFFGTVMQIGGRVEKPFVDPIIFMSLPFIAILVYKEYKDENKKQCNFLHSDNWFLSSLTISLLVIAILLFGNLNGGSFIYFQF